MRGQDVALWLAINKVARADGTLYPISSPEADAYVLTQLRAIADVAQANGVRVALYPHTAFWLARVDDAQRIADQVERHRVRNVDEELEPLVVCLLQGDGRDATHDIFEIEVDGLNIELAGFDFAEIEEVVDDAEQ